MESCIRCENSSLASKDSDFAYPMEISWRSRGSPGTQQLVSCNSHSQSFLSAHFVSIRRKACSQSLLGYRTLHHKRQLKKILRALHLHRLRRLHMAMMKSLVVKLYLMMTCKYFMSPASLSLLGQYLAWLRCPVTNCFYSLFHIFWQCDKPRVSYFIFTNIKLIGLALNADLSWIQHSLHLEREKSQAENGYLICTL